jgi:uncharacterized protein (DUF2132 family)
MKEEHPNSPLHGIKLADILEYLVEKYGWEELAEQVGIRNFASNPSLNSNLKLLRQTPWARTKVENFYLYSKRRDR